ncbi:CDP-glycerol glycerophosphotransferase family protein [Arthrobacter sp. Leaf234]|uniref:CDP-glycerol glycerophosphotransferase family protein n=1 Tax=Arthrobacter sp. Leaf234 TaxID=1736303 RepID=UPI00138F24B2|nr:CDP-glycerol glycerophosphotransferase family protein [Arthrobacter sp. Leaf234]
MSPGTAASRRDRTWTDGGSPADSAHRIFEAGHRSLHEGDLPAAAADFTRALQLDPRNARWQYQLGFVYQRLNYTRQALQHYQNAVELEPSHERYRAKLEGLRQAVRSTRGSVDQDVDDVAVLDDAHRLQSLRADKGPKWQQLDILRSGNAAHATDYAWQIDLATTSYAMKKYDEAALAFSRSSLLEPGSADNYFLEGHSWELSGNPQRAAEAYAKAMAADKKLNSAVLGIGAFFQNRGLWQRAIQAYEESAKVAPDTAEIRYRIALSFDRCHLWGDAARHYQFAIVLRDDVPYWHYKLGLSYERLERWGEAAQAYDHAYSLDPSKKYWAYRSGYSLTRMGSSDLAAVSFLRAMEEQHHVLPETSPLTESARAYIVDVVRQSRTVREGSNSTTQRRKAGELALSAGDWRAAIEELSAAVDRSQSFDVNLRQLRAMALTRAGEFDAAADAFVDSRLFNTSDGVDVGKYLRSPKTKNSLEYTDLYASLRIRPDVILWESNHGASIGCHPLALFRNVVADPAYANFLHVWAVTPEAVVPAEIAGRRDVVFAQLHTDAYKRYLASARFLVNNVSFPPYFIRKEGQRYLNTWHGTPLKTLGRDMKQGVVPHANLARNFLHSTHIMSPNEHTSHALIARHDIEGLFEGKIAVTGSPRIDRLVVSGDEDRARLRSDLGIAPDDGRPVVLYAPTWRGETHDRSVDVGQLREDLESMTSPGHHLFFRAHRLTESLLQDVELDVTVVPQAIDTNDLLMAVDLLITDYSSIFFDFLPTKKPIVFFAYDEEEYASDRGLYFDLTDMPGQVCATAEELQPAITAGLSSDWRSDATYESAIARFCSQEDGLSSERVKRFFFDDDPDAIASKRPVDRPTVLLHHGLIPNGIATSFRNLMHSIDPEHYRIVLVVEPQVLARDALRLANLVALPDHVQIIGRTGVHALTPEEKWTVNKFNSQHDLASPEQWGLYRTSFEREHRRIFGTKHFDAIIEFDGYSAFWTSLAAFSPGSGTRTIYLHNDMGNEEKMKFPELEAVFRLYRFYDRYVSVARAVSERNRDALSTRFSLTPSSFVNVDNQIHPESVLLSATEPVDQDIDDWMNGASTNFLAIGRMSPEKDHAKLIRSFSRYHRSHPLSRLVIVGTGPLMTDLQQLIHHLDASDYIWLAGQRNNPYAILARSDAFILPSLHEGQPMVLFEAMILGKRIVSTDVPGPREVLDGRYGLIVENSEEGLARGFDSLEDADFPRFTFDYELYRTSALQQFLLTCLAPVTVGEPGSQRSSAGQR